jgi:glutathione S-transferase
MFTAGAATIAGEEPPARAWIPPRRRRRIGIAMRATLYGIPGSHNVAVADAMLRYKGMEFRRRDLIPGTHRLLLVRLLGFSGSTVPALKVDRRRVLGTRRISRALDEVRPDPPLFPADARRRIAVEEAERFGEDALQPLARHIMWVAWQRDPAAARTFLEGSRLRLPPAVVERTTPAVVALMTRLNDATDASARSALARLPAALTQVDALIDSGVIGGSPPNAADFQIAAQLRMLMCVDDLRPLIAGRHPRAAALASALYPDLPGRVPPVFSADERALVDHASGRPGS